MRNLKRYVSNAIIKEWGYGDSREIYAVNEMTLLEKIVLLNDIGVSLEEKGAKINVIPTKTIKSINKSFVNTTEAVIYFRDTIYETKNILILTKEEIKQTVSLVYQIDEMRREFENDTEMMSNYLMAHKDEPLPNNHIMVLAVAQRLMQNYPLSVKIENALGIAIALNKSGYIRNDISIEDTIASLETVGSRFSPTELVDWYNTGGEHEHYTLKHIMEQDGVYNVGNNELLTIDW